MIIQVSVRPDDLKPNCSMVVIHEGDQIVSIPLRGVSKLEAIEQQRTIKYAYDAGVQRAFRHIQEQSRAHILSVQLGTVS